MATIELEHAIGYSGIPEGLHYHSNGREFIYAAGGCVVITALDDPHNQTFLRGHTQNISSLAVSPDCSVIASAQPGKESDVLVWDNTSRRMMYRLSEHDFGIAAMGFSHDGRLLATFGVPEDGKVYIWDLNTGQIVATQQKVPFQITAMAWGGMHRDIKRRDTSNYLLATAAKGCVMFWVLNPKTGELTSHKTESASHLAREYTCIQFSADREQAFVGTSSGDFAVISVKSYRIIQCIQACSGGVHSLAAFEHGVFLGGGDGSVLFYNKSNVDSAFGQAEGPVSALSVSPDGMEIVAGTKTGFVYRMQLNFQSTTLQSLLLCENHSGPIVDVAYAAASDRFATISQDGSIRIWDASDYSVVAKANVTGTRPSSLCYSADILISGWDDGCIRCHVSDTGEYLWTIDNAHTGGVTALQLSNNQRFILSGGKQGDVRVWDIRKRDLVSHLKEHTMSITGMALFDDDIHVISCSRDRSLLCWDLRQERRISSHTQRMGGISSICLSRDQTQVLTVGQEKKISYWDLRIESPIKLIQKAHLDEATCIAVAHNLDVIATGGTDHVVKLWNFQTGELLVDGIGHSGTVRKLRFSPDDRQLVSVGDDGNIFVWNMYT